MRLIDADALKDRLDYCVKEGMGSTIAFTFKHIVDDAPTIEPKRGEWIDMWDQYGFEGTFKCSVCGTPWTLIDGTPQDNGMNFCPNCGARMKGADDE